MREGTQQHQQQKAESIYKDTQRTSALGLRFQQNGICGKMKKKLFNQANVF